MALADDSICDGDKAIPAVEPLLEPVHRTSTGDHGLGATLRSLASDLHALFRGEIALVRAQIGERVAAVAAMAAGVAVGALLAIVGLLVFVLGIAAAVALWIPPWAALLLTGSAVIAIGGAISWLTVTSQPKPAEEIPPAKNGARLALEAA